MDSIAQLAQKAGRNSAISEQQTNNSEKRPNFCCVARIQSSKTSDFIKFNNGRHWVDRKDEALGSVCYVKKVKVKEDNPSKLLMCSKLKGKCVVYNLFERCRCSCFTEPVLNSR